jgi:two-component system, OmpR family, phosphate regulon sensor histidine kinase PhoR
MRIKIHYKFTVIFSFIIGVILFFTYLYLDHSFRQHTYQRIRSSLIRETSLSRSFMEEAFTSETADLLADKIGRDLKVRATVIALDGTVLGDSDLDREEITRIENHKNRPEIKQALSLPLGESRRYSMTVEKDMLYMASVFGRPEALGVIRLSVPLSEIMLISARLKNLLAVSFLAAFICAIIIGFAASMLISGPIKEMAWIAKSIAQGDFSKKASIKTGDEIEDLANSFNYMSDQIRHRIESVTAIKSRFEAVLLSMFEGVMVIDPAGRIVLMNQALKDLFEAEDDPKGKRPIEIIRNIEIQEIVESTLKLKHGVQKNEVSILLPFEKILLVHGTPVFKEGTPDGVVLVFHDITELRRLEKIRQDFVANVSHELRTPVTNIKGYAETLLEGAIDDKKNAMDFVKIIYSDSERLARLVNDILDLSRIEAGKLKMNIRNCNVRSLAEKVILSLDKQAKDKSIKMENKIPDNINNVSADEALISQVLLNLMDNAVKYNNEGGNIRIAAHDKGEFIQVDVTDAGAGIPEKDLSRIFERFYRVDKARSREMGGTGLGLSIVKHIIQSHGGEVSVKSILGQGSTFSFTIPKA